jgi:flagellin
MSRINTNVTSMVAARTLTTQQTNMQKSLERLSTGLRINRGSDDPAGLIASEVLRGEKTALTAAIANGQRASNVIGTAEGGLNEVSNLLSQMESLVSTSANKSGQSDDEIAANQLQVDSILSTINRIADSTEFEGMKLLNGAMDYKLSSVNNAHFTDMTVKSANLVEGATKTVVVTVNTSAQIAKVLGSTGTLATSTATLQVAGNFGTQVFSFAGGTTAAQIITAVVGSRDLTGVSAYLSVATGKVVFTSTGYGSDQFVTVSKLSGTYAAGGTDLGQDVGATINGQAATGKGLNASVNTTNLGVEVNMNKTLATKGVAGNSSTFYITGGGANFSLAADVLTGKASVGIQSVSSGSLGNAVDGYLSTISDGQTNALSTKNLGIAQRIVKSAIKEVANLRGRLGAFQKLTIESTVNSMSVALENTSAAESAIRDTDFANETSNMTRSQILVQAATTVLKQVNSAPQSVLSLLQ